jgi:hypothetical protein
MYDVGDIVRFINPIDNQPVKARVTKKQTDKFLYVFSNIEQKYYVVNVDSVLVSRVRLPGHGIRGIWAGTPREEAQENNSSNPVLCSKCNILNEYAVPNQANGTYLCYECRSK